jgi:hypothetical protein
MRFAVLARDYDLTIAPERTPTTLGGTFEPRKNLGRHAFPHDPEVGFMIEIDGEQYDVTEVYLGFCHVRPANVAYRTHVRYRER